MAIAAMDAATDKAKELGLHWLYGAVGIMRAAESTEETMVLLSTLGVDRCLKLGEALQKAEMFDMQKEAEEILGSDKED